MPARRWPALLLIPVALAAAPPPPPPAEFVPPRGYVCGRAAGPVTIDGKLDDPAWQAAPWTDGFIDIEDDKKPRPRFRTRAKMLWDDQFFYVAAELEEPHVWGTLTRHDAVIFHDNDFELFLDPDGDNHLYGELELNALNTTWDLLLPKPYKDGGPAINGWEIAGLRTAVHVRGTLNDPRDVDAGWSLEIALPWPALKEIAGTAAPPKDGDRWRVNFSRVEWRHEVIDGKYRKLPKTPEDNWVWSPQGVIDMHRPETCGEVLFSTAPPGTATFRPDPASPARHALHRVYYAQKAHAEKYGRYAATLAELGLAELTADGMTGPVQLEVADGWFQATAELRPGAPGPRRWRIRADSRVWGE